MKVTFAIPEDGMNGRALAVVGDFNGWDPMATPLRRAGHLRTATVSLPAGGRFTFRYLAEGGRWFDDDDVADSQPNPFRGQDGVLDLSQAR